jgi:hypothetical protein
MIIGIEYLSLINLQSSNPFSSGKFISSMVKFGLKFSNKLLASFDEKVLFTLYPSAFKADVTISLIDHSSSTTKILKSILALPPNVIFSIINSSVYIIPY